MRRVVILGNAGSGKSTLARALGARLDLTVVHLDTLFWEPGWIESATENFRERIRSTTPADAWVSEGNYARRTFDLRLPQADLLIWLDTPKWTCLQRVVMRNLMNRPRADLPAGCTEKLNRDFLIFLKFVWQFDRVSRPGIEAKRLEIAPKVPVVHLRGTRQIASFLNALPAASASRDTALSETLAPGHK